MEADAAISAAVLTFAKHSYAKDPRAVDFVRATWPVEFETAAQQIVQVAAHQIVQVAAESAEPAPQETTEAFWARRRIEWEARWPSVGPAAIEAFWERFPGREVPDGGPCVWVDLDGYAVGGATPLDALRRSCELWIETWVESAEHAGDLDEIAANLCQGVLEGGPVFLAGDPRHVAALLERAGADIPDMPDR